MVSVPSEKVVPMSGERVKRDVDDSWFWDRGEDFLEEIDLNEQHPMIVKDLVPRNAQGIFHSDGGVGKSTSFAQLLAAIAWHEAGDTWMNREVYAPEEGRGKVLVISGDEPLKRMGRVVVATGGLEKRAAWQAKYRTREVRLKMFGLDDIQEPLFTADGDEVVASERWKRLMDLVDKWKPDIVNIDTIMATTALSLDSNNSHGARLLHHFGQMAALGPNVMGTMHNSKHAQIRSIMDAAKAACGASQMVNAGRYALSMYRAHPDLADAVVQAGLGGAERRKNVIVVGLSKDNLTDSGGLEPYVFVRQPRDGNMIRPMVEITAKIRELVGGDELLEGMTPASQDQTARRNVARSETGEQRKAREKQEAREQADRIRRVDEVMAEQGLDAMAAADWLDEQEGRQPAAPARQDPWAAKRAEAEARAANNADIRAIMKERSCDAFAACKFADKGTMPRAKRSF